MFYLPAKPTAATIGVCLVFATAFTASLQSQSRRDSGTGVVSGRVAVLERGNRQADDVSNAVVWLETASPVPMAPETVLVNTSRKQFQPHLVVVPVGSRVEFPNSDAFDHNVFSLSDQALFDLGAFGRGESRGTVFERAGIVRVFCNVHPNMSSVIMVRDNPYFAQPLADGSFAIPDVPVGSYTLRVWHERAGDSISRDVVVAVGMNEDLVLELDARQYEFVQHLNKFGRPYSTARRGRRY